jgi:polysaccharide export outer membrane protein
MHLSTLPHDPKTMHAVFSSRSLASLALLLCASCVSPDLPEPISSMDVVASAATAPELCLGPNDVVLVLIPGQPELINERGYRVSAKGAIVLPLCGPVQVAGLGLEQAEERIHEALGEFLREPAVGVTLLERGAQQVHLLGQVRKPGVLVLSRPTTALEALAHAGGFDYGARRDRVAIIRRHPDGGSDVYFFDGETPGADSMRWVLNGDVVFVPRSGVGVFRDEVLPILQGIGFTTSQLTAVAIAADQF